MYSLAVYYVVPADVAFDDAVYQRLVQATLDVQAWYQVASGGVTWALAFPEVVSVYHGEQAQQYYLEHDNWWGSLLPEMRANGVPIWSPGTIVAVWAHGAGWWAGAVQGCDGVCGVALLSVELFPQFNNPLYSGGNCPAGAGAPAWPCTPEGALAHELGHTLGLIHPLDAPTTAPFAFHSIMQTHWNYPDFAQHDEQQWGLLASERHTIVASPFMHTDIALQQPYSDADVVNLPPNGPVPAADFTVDVSGRQVRFTTASEDATLFYWTFGDGNVSNVMNPVHTYMQDGTYTVTLRVSNALSMMDIHRRDISLNAAPPPAAPRNLRARVIRQLVLLQWQGSNNATNFRILRRLNTDPDFAEIAQTVQPLFSETLPRYVASAAYVVVAENTSGQSSPSIPTTVNMMPAILVAVPPDTPQGLRARVMQSLVLLEWQGATNETVFRILRRLDTESDFSEIGQTSQALFNDRLPPQVVSAQYKVVAANQVGVSPESDALTVVPR
jgi:hypothetical protein